MPLINNPHPSNFWSGYSTTPGDNQQAPPAGAPEGWAPSSVNDVIRRHMAATRQLANYLEALNNALQSMAGQAASNVAITGGTVASSTLTGTVAAARLSGTYANVTAGNSQQFAGLTAQQWYDRIHPVGDIIVRRSNTAPIVPPGVSATWHRHDGGFFLKSTSGSPGGVGGSASVNTSSTGAHGHSFSATTSQPVNIGGSTGIGLRSDAVGHQHNVSGSTSTAPAHAHTVSVDPPHILVALWERMS